MGLDDLCAVNEYKVLLELAPRFQADPAALSLLYFKGSGAVVPLDTLATAREQVSQLVTLYLTPVVFVYMAQLQNWIGGPRPVAQVRPAVAE